MHTTSLEALEAINAIHRIRFHFMVLKELPVQYRARKLYTPNAHHCRLGTKLVP